MNCLALALICALTLIFTSCANDSEFVEAMKAAPVYLNYLSAFETEHFTDIFNADYGEVSAAVRCKVERGESVGEELDTAIPIISTPYTLHISEVYFYDGIHEIPEAIEVDAPYGIVGDVKKMNVPMPVLRDGGEYILLLFDYLGEDGVTEYTFNHFVLSRAVEIVGNRFVPMWPCPETFDEFESLAELESALRAVGIPDDFKKAVTSYPAESERLGGSYDGVEELFAKHAITHVVRARVNREESQDVRYDNSYKIMTYHSLEISDVLLGESTYEDLRLAMPYGIYNGRLRRADEHIPVLDDGAEYLLFLTTVETANGTTEFQLAYEPASALKLVSEGYICPNDFSALTYGRYRTYDALADAVRECSVTDDFDLALSKITTTPMRISWVKYDSISELIEKTNAVAVIRARIARTPSRQTRANELETPYAIAVTERLWGNCPDSLTITLPHGVDGDSVYRMNESIPLLADGGEYMLILAENNGEYSLASPPHAAFRVYGEKLYPASSLGRELVLGDYTTFENFAKEFEKLEK